MIKRELIKIDDVTKLLADHPSRNTIYGWTTKKKIPFYKKGRTLFFCKEDIIKWDENNRVMPLMPNN